MVSCFSYVVGNHILKWKHSDYVHISCAGNEVSDIRILCSQLISDKVAFNKKGTGFTKGGTKKFRICTIDRMEQILKSFEYSLK